MTSIRIQPISSSDIDTLLSISSKTFYDAFYHLCKPSDYEEYTSKAFTIEKLLSELNTPNSHFYFAIDDDKPIGYLKLNFYDAQTEFFEPNAMEIQRIYVLNGHQGKQVGKQLLAFAIQQATEHHMKNVWLGVWDKNPGAVRFYESNGFQIIGRHTFPFGDEVDSDWLMRKELR